ncbi:PREDICTED: membrane metallo-endopeptidase-like 1 [Nicrophorus vespilloides]|uniref:Membrane metallo-endopeptidase-like 1 n=1 Tax=Nicrophorus vespilloides TaxID=110193 RepID=A0ABM1N4F8_NICVS|nr:PREDICTED: membrane metallo-endopeptidase-like 1 [Nicrophorus vespilloides]
MRISSVILGCLALSLGRAHRQYVENDIPELRYLDKSVNPCDDFYAFTCGKFNEVHPIPENAYSWDHFTILQDDIHNLAKTILESKRDPDEPTALRKSKAFYSACVNEEFEDHLISPMKKALDYLGGWPTASEDFQEEKLSWSQIGDFVAEYGVPLFFDFNVIPSNFNKTGNVLYISRDPLTNPEPSIRWQMEFDELSYLKEEKRTKRSKSERGPFLIFLDKMALMLKEHGKRHEEIVEDNSDTFLFMREVMKQSDNPVNPNISTIPNEATINQLQNWTNIHLGAEGLDWLEYFNHAFKYSGVKVTGDMKIFQSNAMPMIHGMINLYNNSPAKTIKNFVVARILTYMAPDSGSSVRQLFEEFYKKQGYTVYNRKEYCLRKTLGYPSDLGLSVAVTYEYQKYHFNNNKLQNASDMISDLQAAFQDILDEAEWMDEASREKAKDKANNIITLLGYPDYAYQIDLLNEQYENLRVCSCDHFGNSQRLRAFEQANNMKLLGSKKDREIWNMSPLTVNAFYNRANNRILFPVSVLNPVFFAGEISVLDYGRIGAVIGHEITHGFDNTGKLYTNEGSIGNWWTKETENAFNDNAECFKQQYNSYYIPEIDKYVDGNESLNENIADNGGLRAAFKALQKLSRRVNPLLSVKDYTAEQLFFVGFGTMWCTTETDYYLSKMHGTAYAPSRYRVMGSVSNMPEFAEAFNCPVGSNMNGQDKCLLW